MADLVVCRITGSDRVFNQPAGVKNSALMTARGQTVRIAALKDGTLTQCSAVFTAYQCCISGVRIDVLQVVVVVVVVVVAFSSRARILGECSTIHSPPALFFFF